MYTITWLNVASGDESRQIGFFGYHPGFLVNTVRAIFIKDFTKKAKNRIRVIIRPGTIL
jgi:hypothetical protein